MDFVRERTAELDKGFGENGNYVYFDLNGVTDGSWATVTVISELGETLTVRDISGNGYMTEPAGKKFYCWNTQPDGSGVNYMVGDPYPLTKEENVFYAVWKTQAEIDAIEAAAALLAADKEAFETAKTEAAAEADAKAEETDSAAAKQLIADAKAQIEALVFDETKTLEENISAAKEILAALDTALAAQREADAAAREPVTEPTIDEGDSDESFLQLLLRLLRMVIDFFRGLFRTGK